MKLSPESKSVIILNDIVEECGNWKDVKQTLETIKHKVEKVIEKNQKLFESTIPSDFLALLQERIQVGGDTTIYSVGGF